MSCCAERKKIGPTPTYFGSQLGAVAAWADPQNAYGHCASFSDFWTIEGNRASGVRREEITTTATTFLLGVGAEAAWTSAQNVYGRRGSLLYPHLMEEAFSRTPILTVYDNNRYGVAMPLPSSQPVRVLYLVLAHIR